MAPKKNAKDGSKRGKKQKKVSTSEEGAEQKPERETSSRRRKGPVTRTPTRRGPEHSRKSIRDNSKRAKKEKKKKEKNAEKPIEVESFEVEGGGTTGGGTTGGGGGAAAPQTPDTSTRKKKGKKGKKPPKDDASVMPVSQGPQVAKVATNGAACVEKWVQRALDMGFDSLRNEYRVLAKYTYPDMTVDAFKANHEAGRNRYQDVPCQDQNRVVIKLPGAATDYVHANYVGTPVSDKRFICTQGPLDNTITEFWMMAVQENSETIIMLCNCIETGKNKCAQYWPNTVGETRKIEGANIEITCKEARIMHPDEPTVQLCVLAIRFENEAGRVEKREIRHYQWLDWPDRGVPPCKLTSMELLSRVRGTSKPIIVHCSAGIGRTGTIVAIEYILEKMQAGVECQTMADLLKELRNQRAYTIQNDLQYLYIHRVMLCYFLEKHKARYESILTPENKEKYKKFVEEYNAATGT